MIQVQFFAGDMSTNKILSELSLVHTIDKSFNVLEGTEDIYFKVFIDGQLFDTFNN